MAKPFQRNDNWDFLNGNILVEQLLEKVYLWTEYPLKGVELDHDLSVLILERIIDDNNVYIAKINADGEYYDAESIPGLSDSGAMSEVKSMPPNSKIREVPNEDLEGMLDLIGIP